jgi:hypothetical protein
MTMTGILRNRATIFQYLALLAIVIAGFSLSAWLMLRTYNAKVEPVYYGSKTFSLVSHTSPNPLLDVKNLLLRRYSFAELDADASKTDKVKKSIYDAFLAGDTRVLTTIASQLSYEAKPDGVSYDLNGDRASADYSDFDVHEIIDVLDTTVLLTAYLFDRMNYRGAARRYYSIYHQAMRPLVLPGLDSRFHLVSRRMVAVRAKLRLLLDRPISKQYADASYADTLIETFLQETLADKAFARYRRDGITYPKAAEKAFYGHSSTTTFDPEPLIQAIKAASGPEKKLLVYEFCMSRKFMDSDIKDVCLPSSIEIMFGKRGFATATLQFAALLHFVNGNQKQEAYDYETPDGGGEPVLAKNDKNAILIDQAKQAFESLAASASRSLEDESSFLRDDILYLTYRFYNRIGERERAIRSLCQIAKLRVDEADHVLLAKAILGSNSGACAN